jgi:site-specific recombinase
MFGYTYRSRLPVRHRIANVREKSFEELNDLNWKLRWPFLISTLIGLVLIVFSLVIFSLEIASLAQSTANIGYNGVTYGRTASTGAGIWCGFFILIAGVLILMISEKNFL